MTELRSYIRRPRAAQPASLTALQVAKAYNFPTGVTGKGYTCGIIELGGGFGKKDLDTYFFKLGLATPNVVSVAVAGGQNASDGPNGADGEVLLDIEVAAAVAPGAAFRVYFAPNSDAGFLAAIKQAAAECDVISISWGQAENQWDPAVRTQYDQVFAAAQANGVTIFCAAGDSGSNDSTSSPVTDFPASSPHVVGCGGTRLLVNADGTRQAETTWNDNPASSATGGGLSQAFAGRQVPDVAGNADPESGYRVYVDGSWYIIGGTSAVAPLFAGLTLLLSEALGQRAGKVEQFVAAVAANPTVCYDVTIGNNGAFRAGPGRDQVTGFGVPDGGKLLSVLQAAQQPTPTPDPTPTPTNDADDALAAVAEEWVQHRRYGANNDMKQALLAWLRGKGYSV